MTTSDALCNLYKVSQMFEGYPAYQLIVAARSEEDALALLKATDTESPRCLGWGDGLVEMVGWQTGTPKPEVFWV